MTSQFVRKLFLPLFFSLPFLAFSFEESLEGKVIRKIEILYQEEGPSKGLDSSLLQDKLKSKESYPFSQDTFDADLKALAEEFDWVEPLFSLEEEKVSIVLKIWPKPLIHAIHWKGNQEYSQKKLQRELDVFPKTTLTRKVFNEHFSKLKQFYVKHGFFESQLSYEVVPVENTGEVDIFVTVFEGRSGKIQEVLFEGFSKEDIREAKSKMLTGKYRFFTSWLTGAGLLQEEMLDQDQLTLVNYFQEKGFADAKVDISTLDDPYGNRVIVQVSVKKGPLYRFGEMKIEGNVLFSQEEIKEKISFQEGALFSPEKIHNSIQIIKDLYGHKGYIETLVQYESFLDPLEPVFHFNVSVQESDKYRIGMIHILGNHQTKAHVLLRESLLVPGELFDSRKLEATKTRLQNMGYFKDVNVFTVKNCEKEEEEDLSTLSYRDIYIEVEEAATGSMSLFLGFGSTDKLNGGLDFTERNFNIRGFKTLFTKGLSSLRGGGEFVHARASIGKKQSNYFLTWMDPYFLDSLWRFGFEISKTSSELQSTDYDTDTYGTTLFASYPITNNWTYGLKYRIRYTDTDVKNSAGDSLQKLDNSGVLSAVGTSLVYDSADNIYKPHKGIRSTLETEFSGLGGKFIFLKLGYNNTLYLPVTAKTTLKFRGNLNFLQPFYGSISKRIPVSEKFFLGGEGTVRGYKPYILGPRKNGQPTGGVTSALTSAEYNVEILPILDLFAFVDGGSVSGKVFLPSKLRWSTGVGARIEIMQRAPIIVGYGYPINPKESSDKDRLFFSLQGQF